MYMFTVLENTYTCTCTCRREEGGGMGGEGMETRSEERRANGRNWKDEKGGRKQREERRREFASG